MRPPKAPTRTLVPRSILISPLPRPILNTGGFDRLEGEFHRIAHFHVPRCLGNQRFEFTLQRTMMPLRPELEPINHDFGNIPDMERFHSGVIMLANTESTLKYKDRESPRISTTNASTTHPKGLRK